MDDTGHAAGTDSAEAVADFARSRWDWSFDVGQTMVPDVMLGVVEMLKLVTGPGDRVV